CHPRPEVTSPTGAHPGVSWSGRVPAGAAGEVLMARTPYLVGVLGQDAGATSWLQTTAPVTGGSNVDIRFIIWDTGDEVWDSTVLVDGLQWIANGGTVSVGTDPIPDPK